MSKRERERERESARAREREGTRARRTEQRLAVYLRVEVVRHGKQRDSGSHGNLDEMGPQA